jgi:hypothetical protein
MRYVQGNNIFLVQYQYFTSSLLKSPGIFVKLSIARIAFKLSTDENKYIGEDNKVQE